MMAMDLPFICQLTSRCFRLALLIRYSLASFDFCKDRDRVTDSWMQLQQKNNYLFNHLPVDRKNLLSWF